jgi:tetratricopeptide (TPR) repeat protein
VKGRRFILKGCRAAALIWAAVAVWTPLHADGDAALSARWAAYGRNALADGRVTTAEKAFQRALELDDQDLAAWAGLADTFKKEALADQVLDAYARMIQAVPKSRTAGRIVARGWRTPPPPHLAGYYLYVSETREGGYRKVSPLLTVPTFQVDGLVPGLRYYFMVTSMNDAKPPVESLPSTPWSMVCQTVALP